LLQQFWSVDREDPRVAFQRWIGLFISEFSGQHPPSLATRAARIIREEFSDVMTLSGLARRLGVNARQLRLGFREEFRCSISAYKGAVRMAAAMGQLSKTKVDAVALGVGYKSKTNFYRTLRALTGLTPTAFRKLPKESLAELTDTIWSNLALYHPGVRKAG
jgi:methylphosphotriester-DNA--protein-cysteine methyltransferase